MSFQRTMLQKACWNIGLLSFLSNILSTILLFRGFEVVCFYGVLWNHWTSELLFLNNFKNARNKFLAKNPKWSGNEPNTFSNLLILSQNLCYCLPRTHSIPCNYKLIETCLMHYGRIFLFTLKLQKGLASSDREPIKRNFSAFTRIHILVTVCI